MCSVNLSLRNSTQELSKLNSFIAVVESRCSASGSKLVCPVNVGKQSDA